MWLQNDIGFFVFKQINKKSELWASFSSEAEMISARLKLKTERVWRFVHLVLLVSMTCVTPLRGQTLSDGLQAYWPLDGNGSDQIGNINLTASGDAGFDGFAPLVGSAAARTFETPAVPRAGWLSANGHGSTFGVTNEYTISSWYRLDVVGSGGEKSAFRQLHKEPPSVNAILEQTWGWFSPDAPTTYNHRAAGNDGAQTQSNLSFGTDVDVWNHVVQRVDSAGNVTFWHQKETDEDHGGEGNPWDASFALDNYTNIDTTNMVNGQILIAYYESKAGSSAGQVSADEVAIWNRALSDPEIEQLFDNGKAGLAVTDEPMPSATTFAWNQSGLGDWNKSGNWNPMGGSGAGPPNSHNHTALFGNSLAADATVVVDSSVTINRIEFDNSAHTYAIAGTRSISLDSDDDSTFPAVDSLQGSHEFQVPVTLLDETNMNVASGATLTFNNRLDLNGQTLRKLGAGTIAINNILQSGNGGTLDCFDGVCSGNGTISGDVNNSGGTISPGNSPGVMNVEGNFTQSEDGTLSIELGGRQAGTDHDFLQVEGEAILEGALEISLIDGFEPELGDVFDILEFNGTVSGEFDEIVLPNLSGTLSWDDSDLLTNGTVSVVPEPVGVVLTAVGLWGLVFFRREFPCLI